MSRQCHSQCTDGSAGWLACCYPMTKFACPCLMASVDRAPGEQGKKKKKKSRHCWNGRVDSTGWQSWQTKSALSFQQCNFWPLSDRPHACQAESIAGRGEGWKKLWRQRQVAGLCRVYPWIQTLNTDGSGNKVVVSCGRALTKKYEKNSGVINHVSDALTHSWGSEMKGNG